MGPERTPQEYRRPDLWRAGMPWRPKKTLCLPRTPSGKGSCRCPRLTRVIQRQMLVYRLQAARTQTCRLKPGRQRVHTDAGELATKSPRTDCNRREQSGLALTSPLLASGSWAPSSDAHPGRRGCEFLGRFAPLASDNPLAIGGHIGKSPPLKTAAIGLLQHNLRVGTGPTSTSNANLNN